MKIEAGVRMPQAAQAANAQNSAAKPAPAMSKAEGYAIRSQQDQMTLSALWGETGQTFQSLRDIVKDLLQRQGLSLDKLKDGQTVKVDEQARAEAAKLIAEDGPLGAEKTAERIFQFAKAVSGGDTGKLDKLRSAIDAGYKAAEKAFGGQLPEISKRTMELVTSKLDAWEKEAGTAK